MEMTEVISFRVVKEPYGWAVRMGQGVMTPFQSRRSAIEHASGLVEALRRRGELAEVVVEEMLPGEAPAPVRAGRAGFLARIGLSRSWTRH